MQIKQSDWLKLRVGVTSLFSMTRVKIAQKTPFYNLNPGIVGGTAYANIDGNSSILSDEIAMV